MDHISLPAVGSRPSLNVPLLCASPCVPGRIRFGDFPAHFATTVLSDLEEGSQAADDNLLTLVQSWLYLFVVSEFFGQEIDPSSFGRPGASGGSVLCSLPLQQLRRDWVAKQTLATPQERERTSVKCVELLVQALYACERLEEDNLDIQGLDLVLVSVRILLCTLTITTQAIARESDVEYLIERLVLIPAHPAHTKLEHFPFLQHMIANGWCPHQIKFLLRTCCATTICYFAGMKRGTHPNHPNHQGCLNSDHCINHNVDDEQYSRSHVSEHCNCDPITINEDHMMEIIEQDGIPLIDCRTMLTDSSSIALVKHDPKMAYAAISHVWADGLGNPHSNAMSRCQLERLLYQIQAMKSPEGRHEPIRLWIDTFCIPVVATRPANRPAGAADADPHSLRKRMLKQKAIRMMTPIYAGAEVVLALDSELLSASTYDISFVELTARAHVCGWKGRAWTLQEGALAFKLGYQLSNGCLFTKEGQRMYNEAVKIALWNESFDEQLQLLKECRQSWFLPSVGRHRSDKLRGLRDRDVQFMEVWNSLIGKSTTKPDDFYEIVANLLDFDASQIRKLGTMSNMMEAMIFCQSKVPLDIICLPSDRPEGSIQGRFHVPERPSGITLSEESFKTYLSPTKYDRRLFALNSTQGPTGYRVMIPHLPIRQFCIRPASPTGSNASHVEVTLATSLGGDAAYPKGVYLYFATLASHELLQDTKHCGACFAIQDDNKKGFRMTYACSFTFRLCRTGSSCRTAHPNILPAMLVERDKEVLVDIGHKPPWPGTRRPINLAKVRDGISRRKFYFYLIGLCCVVLIWGLMTILADNEIPSFLSYSFYSFYTLCLPTTALGITTVIVLYNWSAKGGAYRACITSYTGNSAGSRLPQTGDMMLINLFLVFTMCEEWTLSAAGTIGVVLKTLQPSFRQMHRWNRSLDDMLYSEAKVDYRGRIRNGSVPGRYDFPFSEITAAPRTEPKPNAFKSLGVRGAEAFQKLEEALAEPP